MKFMIFILVGLVLLVMGEHAFADTCKRSTPKTSLYNTIEQLEYIRTYSSAELTQYHGRGEQVLGLAGGPIGTTFEAGFEAVPYNDTLYCLNVEYVDAKFFAQPRIYIATNFGRGSCEYKAVMEHERKHVETLETTHNEYTSRYRNHLRNVSMKIPPLRPVSLSEINNQKRAVIDHIGHELKSYMADILSELTTRQNHIDSEEEYRRVLDVCDRWDKKLAR